MSAEKKECSAEAHAAILFHCPHCCTRIFAEDSLEDLNEKCNDYPVESDTIDCSYCNKEVKVLRIIQGKRKDIMYKYLEEKPKIFTEDGQIVFLEIRDNVKKLLATSGAVMMTKATTVTSDGWFAYACVDRLVELREIREIHYDAAGQHRIFIKN